MNRYLIDYIDSKTKTVHNFVYIFADSEAEAVKKFYSLYPKQNWQIAQISYSPFRYINN